MRINQSIPIVFLFLLCLCTTRTQAQTNLLLDSLQAELANHIEPDTNKVNLLNEIGYQNWIYDPTQSVEYGLQGLLLANQLEYLPGTAFGNRVIGVAHWAMGNYDLGLSYLLAGLQQYQSLGDTLGTANCTMNIGLIYNDRSDHKKALDYYTKAAQQFKNIGNRGRLASTYNNLALVMSEMERYKEAYNYLEEALAIHEEEQFIYGIAQANNRLGQLFLKQGHPNKALPYFFTSIEYGDKRSDRHGKADNFEKVGRCYFLKNDLKQASDYLEQALALAQELDIKATKREVYETMKKVAVARQDFKKALGFQEAYTETKEQLINEEKAKQIASLEKQYALAEKEKEFALLEKEKELESRNLQSFIAFLGGITALLTLFGFYYYRNSQQRKATNLKLQEQAVQLKELDKTKSRFFSNISHELRTPLTLINSPLESALEKVTNQGLKKDLELAHSNSNKLLTLVGEILDLSKLEAGQLQLEESTVILDQLLRRLFYSYESLAKQRQIDLQYDNQLHANTKVVLDISKFEKIINNLLSNAIKFTGSGGYILLKVFQKNDQLQIAVTDTGKGIEAKDLDRIFDRFYQSGKKEESLQGGTGIGLALAKELAYLFGGTLSVDSQIGKGSTFLFSFPFKESLAAATSLAVTKKAEVPLSTLANNNNNYQPTAFKVEKSNLLIVEDNREMTQFLVNQLESEYHCWTAINGEEGLKQLATNSIDLITSDVMMPDMDGFTFKKRLGEYQQYRHIPFIMLTARSLESDKLKGFKLGVDDYITKPFQIKELKARMATLLNNKQEREDWQKENLGISEAADEPAGTALDEQLKQAEEVVLQQLSNSSFSVKQFAKEMAYSERQLARIIKKHTGLSTIGFIREIRLQKAYRYLEKKQFLTIGEVMMEVGFENGSYFARKFQERFGRKPSEFLV